ncbi:hypothetical protein QJS10_CPA08g00604 [Acorus calamus]|uniref:Uncharacterized protein n=1 Tax=Acorus calamus TaxID=4465 RepID=A0AAV9EDP6_ACOCL|nr:hypothetical protein QJS10_CPA08g00609 [Acorus calamus]KAK1310989.1 hypothetical protein QJS10_CPA08g00604 [Acorus calamus]
MEPDMEAAQKLIELSVDDAEEERRQSRSRPNITEEGEKKFVLRNEMHLRLD